MDKHINFKLALKNYNSSLLEKINFLRSIALDIDDDPEFMMGYANNDVIKNLCQDRDSTCYTRTKLLEAFSYGDAGVLLACPGPSLSGLMLRELGNQVQQEYFFNFIEKNKATSFLAVTEPNKGSDAGQMQTYLKKPTEETYILNGEKWLVGHGADAPIGVLIARIAKGPLGIIAILLTPELLSRQEVYRHHLETVGLRGARLSRLIFNNLIINKRYLLGMHLSPMQRGMMAVMKTFNRMRPGVAAFAIGHAQAVIDYIFTYRTQLLRNEKIILQTLNNEISIARTILYDICKKVDANPNENAFASIAKVKATKIAEKCSFHAIKMFGKDAILNHPLLIKWYRDAFGYEYMEGTSHMQFKNIYQHYLKFRECSHV